MTPAELRLELEVERLDTLEALRLETNPQLVLERSRRLWEAPRRESLRAVLPVEPAEDSDHAAVVAALMAVGRIPFERLECRGCGTPTADGSGVCFLCDPGYWQPPAGIPEEG